MEASLCVQRHAQVAQRCTEFERDMALVLHYAYVRAQMHTQAQTAPSPSVGTPHNVLACSKECTATGLVPLEMLTRRESRGVHLDALQHALCDERTVLDHVAECT